MQKTKRQKKDAFTLEFSLVAYATEEWGGDGGAVQQIDMTHCEFELLRNHPCLSEVQPATDATAPDWMEMPDFHYVLGIWIKDSDTISETPLTRSQYIQLKEKLASLRAKTQGGKKAA